MAGAQVWFRAYDVDDPFDDVHGPLGANDIAGVNILDQYGPLGDDNRGSGGMGTTTAYTDKNGVAWVPMTVSLQPGDNYRAAATLHGSTDLTSPATTAKASALSVRTGWDGKLLANGDYTGFITPVFWSPMLTVWRRLHVETESMVRPAFADNTWRMHWLEPRTGGTSTQVIVKVHDGIFPDPETIDQQFRPGMIELDNLNETALVTRRPIVNYKTWETTGPDQPDEVTINIPDCGGGQSGLACLNGAADGWARLSDDELQSDATFSTRAYGCDDQFTLSGSPYALAGPDLTALHERYAPAYIDAFAEADVNGVGGLTTFLRNEDFLGMWGGADLWNQCRNARTLPVSTANYWTAFVVSAWQAEVNQDADPDVEFGQSPGVTKGISTHKEDSFGDTPTTASMGATYTGICAIFKAVLKEASLGADSEKYTVVHEIGHTFGLDHSDNGAMCAEGPCQSQPFTATSLKKLREYAHP